MDKKHSPEHSYFQTMNNSEKRSPSFFLMDVPWLYLFLQERCFLYQHFQDRWGSLAMSSFRNRKVRWSTSVHPYKQEKRYLSISLYCWNIWLYSCALWVSRHCCWRCFNWNTLCFPCCVLQGIPSDSNGVDVRYFINLSLYVCIMETWKKRKYKIVVR